MHISSSIFHLLLLHSPYFSLPAFLIYIVSSNWLFIGFSRSQSFPTHHFFYLSSHYVVLFQSVPPFPSLRCISSFSPSMPPPPPSNQFPAAGKLDAAQSWVIQMVNSFSYHSQLLSLPSPSSRSFQTPGPYV